MEEEKKNKKRCSSETVRDQNYGDSFKVPNVASDGVPICVAKAVGTSQQTPFWGRL